MNFPVDRPVMFKFERDVGTKLALVEHGAVSFDYDYDGSLLAMRVIISQYNSNVLLIRY